MYKTELARKVKQPPLLGQDNYASFFYLLYAEKCVVVNKPLYYYWINAKGASKDPIKQVRRRRHLLQNTELILGKIAQDDIHLKAGFQHRLQQKWAKEWYHYIREDKSFQEWKRDIAQKVFSMLDLRRSLQLRYLLYRRHIRLVE